MPPVYPAFSNLDQVMQYDQYVPADQTMIDAMQMPIYTEMEYTEI
jgi:hypothetical protein